MTRRRWIADRVEGHRAWLTGDNADHLARVLRAKPGQQFDIAAEDAVRLGTVLSVSSDEVEFELGERVQSATVPEISILLSIFKFDRLEWSLEKLTELGVARIIPVISRRTGAHLAKASEKRMQRWRKITLEAAHQARRMAPPEMLSPVSLRKAVMTVGGDRIVLSEVDDAASLKLVLRECKPPIALAFGPEGGWTTEDLQLFNENGWKPASLGGTILRTETAAIAACAIALAELT
jgi:16S rRNA (uracil1498-N3)-methyltransferase